MRRLFRAGTLAVMSTWLLESDAFAHERWVPHSCKYPVNHAYFRSMRREVLVFSLAATAAIAVIVAAWYLAAVPLLEKLTPTSEDAKRREARRPWPLRWTLSAIRFVLDGDVAPRFMERGLAVSAFVFSKLPALVLALGVYQGWLVMPSFPLEGHLGFALRAVEAILAVWAAAGRQLRALGVVLIAVFAYLCFAYGIAAIDAIPVLATAFYYYYADPRAPNTVNTSQLVGLRLSLGIGFFLLGLINKIYIADLFIGVGDQFPALLEGPRHLYPALTRESWSFTTALGEMSFGLMLLLGVFDKITTIALITIFTNFIFTFGWAEIVHLYPIAGFLVLFFRAPPGTVLDGSVFRTHVRLWRWAGLRTSPGIYATAVSLVAVLAAALLMFAPLYTIVQIVPRIVG